MSGGKDEDVRIWRPVGVATIVLSLTMGAVATAKDYPELDADYVIPEQGTWSHWHNNYPPKPYGLTEIRNTFGNACGSGANAESMTWKAADNGVRYQVNFHRKLGGDYSSNLDFDVKGHHKYGEKNRFIKSGIGAYNCRVISGSTTYSTHSWGIAVDVSWNYEHYGHDDHTCHVITDASGVPDVWKNHRYTWGRSFSRRDCMHFQYASGY